MLAPPTNNTPCPDCDGNLIVKHTDWGWEVTCTKCDFYDSWHSPNHGKDPWELTVYGAYM